jgi:hypothetical protein
MASCQNECSGICKDSADLPQSPERSRLFLSNGGLPEPPPSPTREFYSQQSCPEQPRNEFAGAVKI